MKTKHLLITALVCTAIGCNKTGGGDNGNRVIEGIRITIPGKWKAEYIINRSDQSVTPYPAGNVLEFKIGSTDSALYYQNDEIKSRNLVTWETNSTLIPGSVLAVMNSTVLPKVAVEGVFNDTLYMFTPDVNGSSFVFSRK